MIQKVYIVYKQSTYKKYFQGKRIVERIHPIMRGINLAHREHETSLKMVEQALKEKKIDTTFALRRHLGNLRGYDLVITVGGDGTVLQSSHHIKNELLLGVNSAPSLSIGALCSIKGQEFPKKLEELLKGKYKIQKRNRLQVSINGKAILPLVLNDVLFANSCPAGTSRYLIKIGRKTENQKSSGIWIATASGSTGAILAAGGKVLPPTSKKIQYLVREPFFREAKKYQLVYGILSSEKKLKIVNKMMEASLFIDGVQQAHPLQFGDEITFSNSNLPLHIIL